MSGCWVWPFACSRSRVFHWRKTIPRNPYGSSSHSALSMVDLLGGQIEAAFDVIVTALPPVTQGRLRALAVTASQRSIAAPTLPTMAEAGGSRLRLERLAANCGAGRDPAGYCRDAQQRDSAGVAERRDKADFAQQWCRCRWRFSRAVHRLCAIQNGQVGEIGGRGRNSS